MPSSADCLAALAALAVSPPSLALSSPPPNIFPLTAASLALLASPVAPFAPLGQIRPSPAFLCLPCLPCPPCPLVSASRQYHHRFSLPFSSLFSLAYRFILDVDSVPPQQPPPPESAFSIETVLSLPPTRSLSSSDISPPTGSEEPARAPPRVLLVSPPSKRQRPKRRETPRSLQTPTS